MEKREEILSYDQNAILKGLRFTAFEVPIDLFSKDAGATAAIGVVARNHSDPSPAKMLDKLHQGVYLVMCIFRLEKGRFWFCLKKSVITFPVFI